LLHPSAARAGEKVFTATPATESHYGLFGLLDHRSSYGEGVFPEPFLIDDSDLETNELRLDWLRADAGTSHADELTAEIEHGFGLVTVEAEFHYERESSPDDIVDGIGNIGLGARVPAFQSVSAAQLI